MFYRKRRLLSLILTLALIICALPVSASAVSEEELDQLKAERDAMVRQRQEQQAVVNSLVEQQASVLTVKAALDERNQYTIWQIQLTEEEIALYDAMIADKNEEVEAARALELEQLSRYRSRVRAMEENGNIGLFGMLFSSSSMSDLLTAADDIGEIMESDRELEDAYIEARENTEAVRAEYEAYKASVELIQSDLRAQQDELEAELEEADRLINEITADIEANASILEEFRAAEQEAETNVANMVIALEKQRAEEAAAAGNGGSYGGGNVVGTGSFIWPLPSSTYITSRFGLRIHPITGEQKSHNGIDISANSGSTIVAADGGTVTMAAWNGGYGNCVMIDHGNGYITLYGHMSSLAVSQGQSVSQGECIAYVGSTGLSTGPHLHFEVYQGGGRIDPEMFFSGLTFSQNAGI